MPSCHLTVVLATAIIGSRCLCILRFMSIDQQNVVSTCKKTGPRDQPVLRRLSTAIGLRWSSRSASAQGHGRPAARAEKLAKAQHDGYLPINIRKVSSENNPDTAQDSTA